MVLEEQDHAERVEQAIATLPVDQRADTLVEFQLVHKSGPVGARGSLSLPSPDPRDDRVEGKCLQHRLGRSRAPEQAQNIAEGKKIGSRAYAPGQFLERLCVKPSLEAFATEPCNQQPLRLKIGSNGKCLC